MDRRILLFPIGLIFGLGIGFVIAAANGVTLDGHDHSAPGGHSAGAEDHAHADVLDLAGTPAPPSIAAELSADRVSGWNLHLRVENFTFAPQNSGGIHVDGQGHAHVYVNGDKIARLYGPWMHIGALPPGQSELRITLNSNDHRDLVVGGELLAAILTVTTPAN